MAWEFSQRFLLCQIGFFQDLFACNTRLGHFLRRQDDVHLFFRQIAVFEDDFPDRAACGIGFLGQHGRPFIADVRQEGRDDADAVVDPGLAGVFELALTPLSRYLTKAWIALVKYCMEWKRLKAMTGSMTFNSNWPFSTPRLMAMSLPMIW